MDNDKAFTLYALTLVAIIGCVLTVSVQTGIATLPTASVFLEHLALALGVRTAYKSFAGFDWVYEWADTLGLYERKTALPALGAEAAA